MPACTGSNDDYLKRLKRTDGQVRAAAQLIEFLDD